MLCLTGTDLTFSHHFSAGVTFGYKKKLMLANVGLRVAAVAISILVLTYRGGMIVLRCVNMYKKNKLNNINMCNFCRHAKAEWH